MATPCPNLLRRTSLGQSLRGVPQRKLSVVSSTRGRGESVLSGLNGASSVATVMNDNNTVMKTQNVIKREGERPDWDLLPQMPLIKESLTQEMENRRYEKKHRSTMEARSYQGDADVRQDLIRAGMEMGLNSPNNGQAYMLASPGNNINEAAPPPSLRKVLSNNTCNDPLIIDLGNIG